MRFLFFNNVWIIMMLQKKLIKIVGLQCCWMAMLYTADPDLEGVKFIKQEHETHFFGAVFAAYVEPSNMHQFMQDGCRHLPREFVMSVNKPDEFYTCSKHSSLRDKALLEAGEGIQNNIRTMGFMLHKQGSMSVPVSPLEKLVVHINHQLADKEYNPIALALEVQKLVAAKTVGTFEVEGHVVTIEQVSR